ncbi:methyl-accepting chemotaxis protein [Proteus sp. NMG38-2]|uniref:methyl-accepting chemotaxis protein n=1 Tax=Proteus sp. NMG38-2 TaxID=2883107 RepID=UPI001D0A3745|nr:methyl-accepting chemotaxis protein [Proteus sp. NMG38-2]UDN34932.1 methyl-accepting chemotaxis protein [Proteus sp. NMG38-2]
MFFKNVKIRTKLTIAFTTLVMLIMLGSSFALIGLNSANQDIHDVVDDIYPATVKANLLINNFNEFIIFQQLTMLDEQGSLASEQESKKAEITAKVAQLLKELEETAHDDESKKILAEVYEIRQKYITSQNFVVKAFNENNRHAAVNELITKTAGIQLMYRDKLLEFIALQNQKMNAAGEAVERDFIEKRVFLVLLTLISIILGSVLGWFITKGITRPLDEAVNFAKAIANGDLTQEVNTNYHDEAGMLLRALAEMKKHLLDVVQNVQNGAENISSAAEQITAGSQNLAARTEEQATSVEETASSMEQMTSTVKNTAEHTLDAINVAEKTEIAVHHNGEMMLQLTEKMRAINNSSSQMTDIINLIDSIAFQTNILALNAAVEAARAGEHGKGFAVVASEVRLLAQKSADSANDIRTLIENSSTQTQEGMDLVEQAELQIQKMITDVEEISALLREIGQASNEQSDGISQINNAVSQLDSTTQQNTGLVEESVAAAGSLNEQALNLNKLVNYFQITRA